MFKKMKRTTVMAAALASLLLASCRKDFGDMNVDTEQPSPAEMKTYLLLPNAQLSLAGTVFGNNTSNFYVQYLAEGPYPGGSLYSTINFDWGSYYTGPLFDLKKIIEFVDAEAPEASGGGSLANQKAVAEILTCYYYIWLTDRWGAIPYSEALLGDADLDPAYDAQQDIYNSCFERLSAAVAGINESGLGVTGDILFDGNMLKWKKFANTLRMDMALRLSKVDFAKGKTEFANAIADMSKLIGSNSDNMAWTYSSGNSSYYNPWYSNYTISARNDYAISKTMTDYMLPKNDRRISVYAELLPTGYVGLPYGLAVAKNIPNVYSRIGSAFRDIKSPARIYNYPQVLFMMAEAHKIGYLSGGDVEAAIAYEAAIRASWQMNGVYNATDFANYYATVAYDPATGYEQIMTEKWVHNYLNGYAAWNDWRRTGYPELTPAVDRVNSTGIPVRQAYATSEQTLNKVNYEAAVAAQGTDDLDTKVWWDKD